MKKLLYYPKRICQLGFLHSIKRINHYISKKAYASRFKKNALRKQAGHKISTNFDALFITLQSNHFLRHIWEHQDFQAHVHIPKQKKSSFHSINWLHNYPLQFYQQIKPIIGNDIKNVWEPSRFQHIWNINKKTFVANVTSWITHNPFLLGPNWVCPMEVAIRAINLLWGFYLFKHEPDIEKNFWKRYIEILYDHAQYLENNWETSDKPNNHYIADLLGYFYLCNFFDHETHFEKEKHNTYKKLLDQFNHHILDDGTSYEGSTCYHTLVTEMCLHFKLLCEINKLPLPKRFTQKYAHMWEFLQDCSYDGKHIIQIGDNDSGKIVFGIHATPNKHQKNKCSAQPVRHYPSFGLTIITTSHWHITFRHPTYKAYQPSGHFHQDELSITLATDGIPILVDPGSFVYTQDPYMRNLFRSKKMHNTFYIEQNTHWPDLFQLPRIEQKNNNHFIEHANTICVQSCNHEYKKHGITQHRQLVLYKQKNKLEISDWVNHPMFATWNFIFHPNITIEKINTHCFVIKHTGKHYVTIYSTLDFKIKKSFYSPKYGKIIECTKIFATHTLSPNKKEKTVFKYCKN